ncbi:MAG: hypothetical protein HGA90_03955 [Alphaproteobacteria bacterium]|nr:hypothetical protein [Alphaproteobacteria bacterium]
MMLRRKQGGITLFLGFLALTLAGSVATPVWAAGQDFSKTPPMEREAEEEKLLSIDEFLDGAEDLLPAVVPADATDITKAEISSSASKDSSKKETKEKTPASPVIEAKKIEAPSKEENKEANKEASKDSAKSVAPPAPYRVYRAPMVPEAAEEEVTPVSYSATKAVLSPREDSSPEALAGAAMPDVLPKNKSYVPAALSEAREPAATTREVVAGIGNQFFPLFSLGAEEDAPPQKLPLFSNHDLSADHSAVTRAVVYIHDVSRNPGEGVATLTTLAGADNDSLLIVAPQFLFGIDVARFASHLPDSGRSLARWPASSGAEGGPWQTGGDSFAAPPQRGVSSFTVLDLLLLYLADRRAFPQLSQVVVAGHGMGADYVLRYAVVGKAPDILAKQSLPVRFLVANASSYVYFTGLRPVGPSANFVTPDLASCASANFYPYSLGELVGYARQRGANAIRLRFPERQVRYLVSDKIPNDSFLDTSCAAAMQGRDRLTRSWNYQRHLMMSFGDLAAATQHFTLVPNGGYDPVSMFGSYCGLAVLFGDGACSTKASADDKINTR